MPRDAPTILVSRYRRAAKAQTGGGNSYKGHGMHALPGLHEFIGKLAVEYFEPGAAVLDLAAGTGAMSLRMQDLGFEVTATDYVTENFKLQSVPFLQADLNGPFSASFGRRFQAVIASEIIEHLENPRHFARESLALLAPGGKIIVSTPNVENAGSKASFMRSGRFLWFDEHDYEGHGHITPLAQWQIERAFAEAGWRPLWKGSFGAGASRALGSPRLRLLAGLVRLLSSTQPSLAGEIFVAVFQKPAEPGA